MKPITPVAEYRRVAILEMAGDRRAVWEGREHRTDGRAYVWERLTGDGKVKMLGFTSEADLKGFLDAHADTTQFLTMAEALDLLGDRGRAEAVRRDPPRYEWDEVAGHFRLADGLVPNVPREDGRLHVCCFCNEPCRTFVAKGFLASETADPVMREYSGVHLACCLSCRHKPKEWLDRQFAEWMFLDLVKKRRQPWHEKFLAACRKVLARGCRLPGPYLAVLEHLGLDPGTLRPGGPAA